MKQNLLEVFLQQYDYFTKSEQKIVDYILDHKAEAKGMGIADLANACHVSVSTISVFCKKLEFDGFNDFKLELVKAMLPVSNQAMTGFAQGLVEPGDSTKDIVEKTYQTHMSALLQTLQMLNYADIQRAVDLMDAAQQVVCLGQGSHSAVVTAAFSRFSSISNKFKTVQDSHLQKIIVSTLQENDVILYFSYTGATHEFLDLASLAKTRGCRIILVTRFLNSPGAAYGDVILQCGSDEKPMLFGSIAAITAQLYMVDVLYHELFCRDYERASEVRKQVSQAFSKKWV